jgi:hypothetical protein
MRTRRAWIAAFVCLVLFVSGYGVRVLAEGAPNEQLLFYSGTLEVDGALATGEHTVKLVLYSAETDGDELCSIERMAEVESGRFRIDASDCAHAVRSENEVWVGVAFRGPDGVERAIAGRSKIGAVPYALEADNAWQASFKSSPIASRRSKAGCRRRATRRFKP